MTTHEDTTEDQGPVPVPKRKSGTFCVVIDRQLVTPYCPLPLGSCMWKHRQSGRCMYDAELADIDNKVTAAAFARHVGLPEIEQPTVNILRRSVIRKIRDELAE